MDAKEQKKLYVLIALTVVAAVLVYGRFGSKRRSPAAAGAEAAPIESAFDAAALRAELEHHAAFRVGATNAYVPPVRDPFAWPGSADAFASAVPGADVVATPPFRLRAIIHAGADSVASLDGAYYQVGDAIGAYRVVSITATSATLEAEGRRVELYPD